MNLLEKKLTVRGRRRISASNFALPGRRYPIHDINHARAALSMVAKHGTPQEQATVRAAVHRKYPRLGMRESTDECFGNLMEMISTSKFSNTSGGLSRLAGGLKRTMENTLKQHELVSTMYGHASKANVNQALYNTSRKLGRRFDKIRHILRRRSSAGKKTSYLLDMFDDPVRYTSKKPLRFNRR